MRPRPRGCHFSMARGRDARMPLSEAFVRSRSFVPDGGIAPSRPTPRRRTIAASATRDRHPAGSGSSRTGQDAWNRRPCPKTFGEVKSSALPLSSGGGRDGHRLARPCSLLPAEADPDGKALLLVDDGGASCGSSPMPARPTGKQMVDSTIEAAPHQTRSRASGRRSRGGRTRALRAQGLWAVCSRWPHDRRCDSSCSRIAPHGPPPAVQTASSALCQQTLQHRVVQHLISQQPLQPGVLSSRLLSLRASDTRIPPNLAFHL